MPAATEIKSAITLDQIELRKQFIWLYGIIVGLAIREAATQILPLLVQIAPPPKPAESLFYLARFAVLMLLVIRFYLGAVTVMSRELRNESSSISEGITLLSGLAHFVLFYVWASTLKSPVTERGPFGFSIF